MESELFVSALERVGAVLLSPGSMLSVWSMLAAFLIAVGFAIAKRGQRTTSMRAMVRGMFPSHRLFGVSARTDIWFMLFSVFASSALLGWAVMSHLWIADLVIHALGRSPALGIPAWAAIAAMTLALWVAYEFAYWLNHMLSHKIPALWAFHKVHHSAETLSPLTVFRVHPVDSIAFYNTVAIVTGATAGGMRWLVGDGVSPAMVAGTNVLMIAGIMTIKHLHHSHVWIAWGGIWGRLILSPAHHQIHHSVAPQHHDRNFGDVLGVFDWLAGTLHIPQTKREQLTFGVEGLADPHTIGGALLTPFGDAFATVFTPKPSTSATF